MIAAAFRPVEALSLVLAASGALVLASLVWRRRAGRPLLRAVKSPFRPASPGRLLFLALLVFVAAQLGALLVVYGGATGSIPGLTLPLAASVYVAWLARRDVLVPRGSLSWRIGMGLLHLWASLPLVYGTFLLARWIGLPEQNAVVHLRDRAEGWQALALSAVLVAPVAEEICFRGLVYPALRMRLPARHAILFTSAAFAFVHPPAVWLPMAILAAFLAWLVETSGSVAPAIAAHMAFNALNVAQLLV